MKERLSRGIPGEKENNRDFAKKPYPCGKILIAGGDGDLKKSLTDRGHRVRTTPNIPPSEEDIFNFGPDIIIISASDENPSSLKPKLNSRQSTPTIVFSRSKDEKSEVVREDNLFFLKIRGAKHQSLQKLYNLIEGNLDPRGGSVPNPEEIRAGDFTLHLSYNMLERKNASPRYIRLGNIGAEILNILMRNPNEIYTSVKLANKIWIWENSNQRNLEDFERRLHVQIYLLRGLIEKDPANPKYLKTAKEKSGKIVGYYFDSTNGSSD